jgi:tRNA A37 threonylcarbamoyladenosine dehydratase
VITTTTENMNNVYKPMFFRPISDTGNSAFHNLRDSAENICYDTIDTQILELLACRNPSLEKVNILNSGMVDEYLRGKNETRETYGVWVYYPWKNQLVHILDEEEFIEVRTNRNKYKITQEEQDLLRTKIIGIAGLSVGRAVATTMALERICGEIRLADFDDLELSNLNRINAPLSDMGIPKTISAAREIMEVDPFIKITCYSNGLTEENLEDFFLEGGKMDLFIEECDGLDIKVLSRIKAKQLGIPVVMEASDRAVLDIERFDLEPNRKILHGSLDGLDVDLLKSLKTNEEKMPYMLSIVGYETLSNRIKSSMLEIKESITTWPQLSSAISFGGGLVTNVSRRILLNQLNISGRFYNDMADLVNDSSVSHLKLAVEDHYVDENSFEYFVQILNKKLLPTIKSHIDIVLVKKLVSDACLATSIANSQPWKWLYREGRLYLFLDRKLAKSFWDKRETGALASMGAAIYNLRLSAEDSSLGMKSTIHNDGELIASFVFNKASTQLHADDSLYSILGTRYTNRTRRSDSSLSKSSINFLNSIAYEDCKIQLIHSKEKLTKLGDLLGKLDRIRLLNSQGQKDFYNEIKFSDTNKSKLGISVEELKLSNLEYAGLRLSKDSSVSENLSNWGLGRGLDSITRDFVLKSSGLCLLSLSKNSENLQLRGGEIIQKLWLECTLQNIAVHPITTAVLMFQLLEHNLIEGISHKEQAQIIEVKEEFYKLFNLDEAYEDFFLFRVFDDEGKRDKMIRRDLDEVLHFG